jgi:hypothetical protein
MNCEMFWTSVNEELGELLNKKHAAISRLERRSDMHISALRAFVTALGRKTGNYRSIPGRFLSYKTV